MPCLRQTSTTVSPDSASRSTLKISSSPCPRLPISWSPPPLQGTTKGRNLSTSKRLSFWVLGHARLQRQLHDPPLLLYRRPRPCPTHELSVEPQPASIPVGRIERLRRESAQPKRACTV